MVLTKRVSKILCLSLCLSVTTQYCIKTAEQMSLLLAYSLPSIYSAFSYLQKYGYFPLEFVPNFGLRNIFAMSRQPLQVLATVEKCRLTIVVCLLY